MSRVVNRVFVPVTARLLAEARERGSHGPAPVRGHAVTDALREALPDGDEEEWEYVAMSAAALDSVALLAADDAPLRMVAAFEAPSAEPVEGPDEHVSAVRVPAELPVRLLAAVLADSEEAADSVREAVADGTEEAAGRTLVHELGWYAAQELDDLLGSLRAR